MRICFVGMEIVPIRNDTFVGSVSNNVVRLSRELSLRGHEISIVTSDVSGKLETEARFPWGTIHPIHSHGSYASLRSGLEFLSKAIPKILRIHRRGHFDIIHGHSAYPLLAPVDGLSSALGDVPSIFTLYSPIRAAPLGDRKGFYQSLSTPKLSRLLFAGIQALTVLSVNTKESLVSIGIREDRVESLPPIVDVSFFNIPPSDGKVKAELGVPEDSPVLLYVGNWATWKGVDFLIDSMAIIKNVFPDVRLITAWGEPYSWYDERRKLIEGKIRKLRLDETIVQTGINEDLSSLIHSSDAVVAPFLNTDGVADLPLVILESMACGKPVVSTRVGGIPEILSHRRNGLLVAPGSTQELADALIRLLSNQEEGERMGSSARDVAVRNHSPAVVVDKLEDIYCEVLEA